MRSLIGPLLALTAVTGTGALPASDSSARLDQAILEIADEHRLPSFSVAISRGGEIVYSTAVGFADLENKVPATPQTVYPIGSITKTVTAVAALRLAELGDLDLDAPIQESCPAFPEKSHPITTRQLLAHLAGIRHYDYRRFDEDFLNKKSFDSIEEALGKFSEDPLESEPGSQYHYSSWGYVVVGCAIEGASGLSYAEAIQRDVLGPASMKSTRLDVIQDIIPHRACGYSLNDDGAWTNSGCFNASDRYPAGGLVGTADDLVTLANALLEGNLLNEESLKTMTSSQTTSSQEDTGRGLGLEIGDTEGELSHGGTSVGASSYLYIRPEEKLAVAILTNLSLWTKPRQEVARRLAEIVLSSE
jgi:serine beta-lactamase-like protein LACTB